jgi:hypothetical protein
VRFDFFRAVNLEGEMGNIENDAITESHLYIFIYSFSSLSYDRSKASSKASSPNSAIYSFLLQMRVSSPFLKVIQ